MTSVYLLYSNLDAIEEHLLHKVCRESLNTMTHAMLEDSHMVMSIPLRTFLDILFIKSQTEALGLFLAMDGRTTRTFFF